VSFEHSRSTGAFADITAQPSSTSARNSPQGSGPGSPTATSGSATEPRPFTTWSESKGPKSSRTGRSPG
jgi:hypothetical protein